jgi:tRNA (adenine37-N6)-methyltransferase
VFQLQQIGVVRGPHGSIAEIPTGPGAEHRAEGWLELLPEFADGLRDIDGFSHLYVIWLFHQVNGFDLLVQPPTDDREHGIFATRMPRRPNPLGLTVVELLGREENRLRVRGLDMLDGTPILDVKPYLSSVPAAAIRRGWLEEAEARRRERDSSPSQ